MRRMTVFITALVASVSMVAGANAQCTGDVTSDSKTDIVDLLQLLGEWGCNGCASDLNGDAFTDIQDLLLLLGDWGCDQAGPGGPGLAPTNLSGTVTNFLTGAPLENAEVTVGVDVLYTDATGFYSGDFDPGTYDITVTFEYFDDFATQVTIVDGVPEVLDVALNPVAPVVVNVVPAGDGDPGGSVDVLAEVIVLDGSTILTYAWSQVSGAPAVLVNPASATVTANLATALEYKTELVDWMSNPPVEDAVLEDYIPPPSGAYHGGQQDRWQVLASSFMAIEEAGAVELSVDVTTDSGTYNGEGPVHTTLPWKPNQGLRTVPLESPLILHGKLQGSYDWVLSSQPNNSSATLTDATTQFPEFTPDWPGIYDLMVTDTTAAEVITIQVFAGNWRGIIEGQDLDGKPVSDSNCFGCHSNLGFDKFTPWAQTGHAEIFTVNLDTSTHYGTGCFPCHTVGFDPDASNNGFDDAYDYDDFLASGLLNNPGDNWTTMLADYPWSATLANAQCENCHGPQWSYTGVNTLAHGPVNPQGEPRVDVSASVCGTCHGEPPRHARFQQWQISPHANYELAVDEGDSGNCSRCHTANGFLAWLPILLEDEPGDPLDSITVAWTSDEVHPQTCTTCHDPHAAGNTSGSGTNATVRISGDTPPLIAGFTATDVGRGAICMTCHNSRRGLRNDAVWPDYVGTSESARAPHGSAQTDMLMGENAYLVTVGVRGSHSNTVDTCATCHMVETLPPASLSYNQGGTNHTFYADREICANCHGAGIDADFVQGNTQTQLNTLSNLIEAGFIDVFDQQILAGNTIDLNGDRTITDVADISEIVFGEYRGRQSITVTFTDAMTYGPYRLTDIDVVDGTPAVIGQIYLFMPDDLLKAGWNWNLVNNDGSLGVHNFAYTSNILSTSINALTP